ncbi:hypothetical protein LTR94_032463, partial [Friedmanniomyces endolithicus]
ARQAMDRSRGDIEAHASALTALIDAAQTGVADTSAQVRQTLTQDLDAAEAELRTRLDNAQRTIQAGLATTDEALTRRALALETLVSAAEKGIGQASEDALAVLERDMEAMETDLRRRLDAALQRAQETLAVTDGGLSSQAASLDALVNRSRESLTAIGDDTVAGL